jgi:hypothetical protein
MRFVLLLTLLESAFELAGLSGHWFLWPLRYVAIAFTPGLFFLLVIGKRRLDVVEFFVLATCLSPVLSGISVLLLSLSGMGVRFSGGVVALLFSALSLAFLLRKPLRLEMEDEGKGVVLFSILLSSLLAVLLIANPVLRVREDAWFHTAITYEILDHGIPPQDPFFYGVRLLYFWFYHLYLAGLSTLHGPSPFTTMAILNVHFFLAMALTAYLFSRQFVTGMTRYISGILLLSLGMNPLGVPFLIGKAIFGETRGMGEFLRSISGGVSTVLGGLSLRYLHVSLSFGADKFLVGTAFSMGMVLSLAFLWKVSSYLRKGEKTDLLLSSIILPGAVLVHTVAGLATFSVATGTFLLLFLWKRRHDAAISRRLIHSLLASFISVLIVLPYVLLVSVGKTGGQLGRLEPNLSFLWSTALSGLLFWILAPVSIHFLLKRGIDGIFVATWMLGLLIFGFIVPLPFGNESKFTNLLFVPLSIVSGWFFIETLRKKKFTRLLILALIPCLIATDSVAILAFLRDEGPRKGGRMSFDKDECSAYQWVSRFTQRDALFLDSEDRTELVVTGPRRILWGGDSFAVGWGYNPEDMKRRKEAIGEVFGEGRLSSHVTDFLGSFEVPVYLFLRKGDVAPSVWNGFEENRTALRKVYENPSIRVYELQGGHTKAHT